MGKHYSEEMFFITLWVLCMHGTFTKSSVFWEHETKTYSIDILEIAKPILKKIRFQEDSSLLKTLLTFSLVESGCEPVNRQPAFIEGIVIASLISIFLLIAECRDVPTLVWQKTTSTKRSPPPY
ncbi:unnamed protein product [Pieris macdunnoughi]|uniref:Uncharacterized protein n=1 Tax=Pieris macdunnoughi TaxID=345717 RepID=A0A821S786_9NEOP|nr:unnamed protein product [Pieris macdunnoughi]